MTGSLQAVVNPLFDLKKLARFTVQQLVAQEGKTKTLKRIKELKKYSPGIHNPPCELLQFIRMSSLDWLVTDKLGMTEEKILVTILRDKIIFENSLKKFEQKLYAVDDKQRGAWEKESQVRAYKALMKAVKSLE